MLELLALDQIIIIKSCQLSRHHYDHYSVFKCKKIITLKNIKIKNDTLNFTTTSYLPSRYPRPLKGWKAFFLGTYCSSVRSSTLISSSSFSALLSHSAGSSLGQIKDQPWRLVRAINMTNTTNKHLLDLSYGAWIGSAGRTYLQLISLWGLMSFDGKFKNKDRQTWCHHFGLKWSLQIGHRQKEKPNDRRNLFFLVRRSDSCLRSIWMSQQASSKITITNACLDKKKQEKEERSHDTEYTGRRRERN